MTREEFDWRFEGRRPSLPITFICGLCFWAGCAASYASARTLDVGACFRDAALCAFAACLVGVMSALWFLLRRKAIMNDGLGGSVSPAVIAVCMLLIGGCLGLAQGARLHVASSGFDGQELSCQVSMLEDSSEGSYGESCLVSIETDAGEILRSSARFPKGESFLYGERVKAVVRLKAADVEKSDYGWSRGSALTARIERLEREDPPIPFGWLLALRRKAISSFDDGSDQGMLLQALVCGYRRSIRGTELYSSFQTCGLAHLIAVSGAHLVIVTALFASVLKALRLPRKLSIAVLVSVMASYLVFSGAPVSALRATVMSSVGIVALFARRRPSSLSALGVCLIALICASPSSSVSPSLALSALSTLGIVMFSPLFGAWVSATPLAKAPLVSEPLIITCSAAVLSQPLACALFAKLPLISPLANIICAPFFPLCCSFGLISAALAMLPPPLGVLTTPIAGVLGKVMCWMVSALSSIPYASIPVGISPAAALAGSFALALVLWLCWDGRKVRNAIALAVMACIALHFALPSATGDRIVMLDVGQGDAFLLQSEGRTLLIDTGNQDTMLLKGLGSIGVVHIDSVLVTHADDDHCGSLDVLAGAVDIDRVLVAQGVMSNRSDACAGLVENATAAARDVVELKCGDSFKVGAFSARVVWPHELSDDAGNADSVCLAVEYDGDEDGNTDAVVLFTGDAEYEQLGAILEETGLHNVDVLKVGHHGSRNAFTEDEIVALKPRVALIGVGEGNRYGHPTGEVLSLLDEVGSRVYRTDENGQTTVEFTCDSITVSCSKAA